MNNLMKFLAVFAATLALAGCHDDDVPVPDNTPTPLINTEGQASIIGDAITGTTLTADVTDFNGISGPIAYQWEADGADIAGATDNSYVLTTNELDMVITVNATYTDDKDFAEDITSDPTAAVSLPPNEDGVVSISGVPTVGETLTATVSDGNGTTGSTFAFQWLADGGDIAGATMSTYVLTDTELDAMITVNAMYTDDIGYDEDATSDPIGPVSAAAVNVPGTIAISGALLIGETLTATVTDPNGFAAVNYQWAADGADIAGATTETFDLTSAEKGAVLSVTADYTDNDGFAEGPISDTADDIIYTAIVVGETTLSAAAAAAVDGDIIGLDSPSGDDYVDMAEVEFAADNLLVKRTTDSTAVISGLTCVVFSGDGIMIDGLVFDDLNWIQNSTCDPNGDGSVYLSGDGMTLKNSQFLGEAFPRTVAAGAYYHYITLKGVGNVIERNLFTGKEMDEEGAAISIFSSTSATSNNGHIIQYNLFKNFLGTSGVSGNRDSGAHALQIGRSTGNDSTGDGLVTVRYNRFDTVESERRLMRVQSGANTIHDNTVVDSLGLIALEDGYGSTVSRNIVLSAGDDGDDGAISFAPMGHTVVDNYVNNMRTTSGQRAGLLLNPDPMSGSGNNSQVQAGVLDFTVVVARNTVVNARQAIQFENADCTILPPLVDWDDNFVMNQSSALSINGNTNGEGRNAVRDDDWVGSGCAFDAASTFAGNRFYSANLSASGTFDFNGNLAGNTVGAEDGADYVQDGDGLVNGNGVDAGVGVDTSILHLILESEVGPGSTWTATP